MIISLCGFMTSGKTLAGEAFSKEQGLPFIDLDQYIEKQEKKTVLEIFRTKGESYFRTLEVKSLQEIIAENEQNNSSKVEVSAKANSSSKEHSTSAKKDLILSVGGGTPMNPECAKLLKEKTFCIYLQCSPAVLGERLSYLYHNRPSAVDLLAQATAAASTTATPLKADSSATTSAKEHSAEQSENKKLTKKQREELFTTWATEQLKTKEPHYLACSRAQINTDNFHLPTICSTLRSVLSESSTG